MDWLMLTGPVIGGMIGYCTNYVAVKMLFRPRRAWHIGKKRLPLTPGMIPKRKPELARAIGAAVEEHLLTGDDVKEALMSPQLEGQVVNALLKALSQGEKPVDTLLRNSLGDGRTESSREALRDFMLERIRHGLGQVELGQLIVEKGKETLRLRLMGSVLGMFVSDRRIDELAEPLPEEIEAYLDEHLDELLGPLLEREITNCAAMTPGELLNAAQLDESVLRTALTGLYRRLVNERASQAVSRLEIGSLIRQKIDAMNAEELERLALSVMKRELRAIVNLGALIGFVIGFLNLLIP